MTMDVESVICEIIIAFEGLEKKVSLRLIDAVLFMESLKFADDLIQTT